jgi:hypothetical protein
LSVIESSVCLMNAHKLSPNSGRTIYQRWPTGRFACVAAIFRLGGQLSNHT